MLLEEFNAQVDKEDNFTATIGNESLQVISNDNRITVANIVTSKELLAKSIVFSYRNIHKFTWPPDGKTPNHIDFILDEDKVQLYLISDLSEFLIVIPITIWWLQMLRRTVAEPLTFHSPLIFRFIRIGANSRYTPINVIKGR
jgi:hypothetical protein